MTATTATTVRPAYLRCLVLLAAAAAGCQGGPGNQNQDLPSGQMEPSGTSDLGSDDAAPPEDFAMPYIPIPGSLLGKPVQVALSCTYQKRGWMVNMMGDCERTFADSMSMTQKSIRVDAQGAGQYRITAGKTDAYAMDYQRDLSETASVIAWDDGGDPATAFLLTHTYVLNPRSLRVEVELLHNNDTPVPVPMCWLHYSEQTRCTGELTW